jgi:hypothetical protein
MDHARSDDLLNDQDVDAGTAELIDEITSPFDELDGATEGSAPPTYGEVEASHPTYADFEATLNGAPASESETAS